MIPISEWGKDHWSTFAYIETRIVDHKGEPNKEQMRCDTDVHPQHMNSSNVHFPESKYPTRTKVGEVKGHDDWSCLEDAVKTGLLIEEGTGLTPVYQLTDYGRVVASKLREWKSKGGSFHNFTL
jgi:hypothetical protein